MKPQRPRQKRWVVREADGTTVAEILKRAGEEPRAVAEGRVFVGRVRVADASYRVRVGDEVKIGGDETASTARPAARPGAGTGMSTDAGAKSVAGWSVIWERDGMLACNKPAGIPTVADHVGASHALVALAAQATGRKLSELHVTSRLDREVSGVVVFATSGDAEARLRVAREQGRYARRYVAIAKQPGAIREATGDAPQAMTGGELDATETSRPFVWDAPIGAGKDARHRAAFGPDAKAAQTRWRVVARAAGFVMLAVAPQTGRTHQIRVHASHAGAPLLGDRDYDGSTRVTLENGRVVALARIALHAARVTIPGAHGEPLVAEAPIPRELARAWAELGGEPEAWNTAVSCELDA